MQKIKKSMASFWDSSILDGGNQAYLENKFEDYLADPNNVSAEWQNYFVNLAEEKIAEVSHAKIKDYFKNIQTGHKLSAANIDIEHERKQMAVHDLINGYRLLGHLYANIDPLQLAKSNKVPELELDFYGLSEQDKDDIFDAGDLVGDKNRTLAGIVQDLQAIYCKSIASEFMHISDSQERIWVQEQIETNFRQFNIDKPCKFHIFEGLTAAEGLEKYLGAKYPGAKRFGLEGCDSVIVAIDEIIQRGGQGEVQEVVIAMAHRGRLNVLVNILGKMPSELFDEFEGKHSKEVESGDVKYHQGFASDVHTKGGNVHLSMAFNPSHLEIVAPVAAGSVRARQERRGHKSEQFKKVLPLIIHGDSAFIGQGVVMEGMNMSQTRGYGIGGILHIITNNQIGFTTNKREDVRSTLYCSDIGKMISTPIFHVNADDAEAVFMVANLALAYRQKFQKDVIIDLVGYRRHGHNEADEPRVTQPIMYNIIKKHPNAREIYANKLIKNNDFTKDELDKIVAGYRKSLDERDKAVARNLVSEDWERDFSSDWTPYGARDWRTPTSTKVDKNILIDLAKQRDTVPEGFKLHSRVKKIVEDRSNMTATGDNIDWGYAETLAYAALLHLGFGVRLSGQDCGRGTFFHRHSVWHEQNTGEAYISLTELKDIKANFRVIDSVLSEAAVLGFEYGFSTSEPKTLVIWEAQFGDFANNAQVVIDQFISSGEQKWGRLSGLLMLLPHGYEGQGPEHSSARLERYLQLCAQHNIQVCIPSTPAQVYHMLLRQMLRPMRKPLIALSPKSFVRHPDAVSSLDELANGAFLPIIVEPVVDAKKINKVILCSGKVYYDLNTAKKEQGRDNVLIIRIEQLYPFPEQELQKELSNYEHVNKIIWCQEEPQNQGAWYNSQHHIKACLLAKQKLKYVGREPSAAPAVGYAQLHKSQQNQLIQDALE